MHHGLVVRAPLLLAVMVGCSPSDPAPAPTRTDAVATARLVPDAAVDARADANPEIEWAIERVTNDLPADVPQIDWWIAHAAAVRPALLALVTHRHRGQVTLRMPSSAANEHTPLHILGALGHPDDVPLLAGALYTWPDELAKATAAEALGAHPSAAARMTLLFATYAHDVAVVRAATHGVHAHTNKAGRRRLEALLDHDDPLVRKAAVRALLGGGSEAALRRRRSIETDPDVKVTLSYALSE